MNKGDNPDYDPSKDPKGRGSFLALAVVSGLFLWVLVSAYRLHAFWWQS